MKPRIIIADDHALVVEGLTRLLESEFEIVATVNNGIDMLNQVDVVKPDLALVDISMPGLNGLDVARQLAEKHPEVKVLILTMHNNEGYVREALRAGVAGYFLKSSPGQELALAMKRILSGGTYISPGVLHRERPVSRDDAKTLTPRQREVLRLIAAGSTAKEVAAALSISVRTAEFHKVSIMQKLGIRTTAQLTRFALENGLG
jgi:DNA-binding NarL/FixJ family response regulator